MTFKKIRSFLGSMKFAMILLIILILACAAGSFVTQGQTYAWYAARYGERTAGGIIALGLDDVFHSPWFIAITAFLCLNLLLCNLIRLPALIRRAKEKSGAREKAGIWGAWVCHLGVLILIIGFGLGQTLKSEYTVYGVPGDIKPVGDTAYVLTIEDFRTDKKENGSVIQYTTDISVRDLISGNVASGSVSVNNPAALFGLKFFQNSTGWAADMHVSKNGEEIQTATVCAGDYLAFEDKPDLVVAFNRFYPDYDPENAMTVSTDTDEITNPAYLYSAYYQGQLLGMNALPESEKLTIDEYTVTFSDPQAYTLLQVKRDPFAPLALIGGLVTLLGLVLAFYVRPAAGNMDPGGRESDAGAGYFEQKQMPEGESETEREQTENKQI